VRDGVDIAARYGGEEFALILPETDREGAWSLAERVRQLVAAQQIVYGDAVLRVTASLGVATFPEQGERPQALVEAADQALYRAKRNGRNRVEVAGD
jgi:diguanylate cyclase (GGDEF)-like protein